MKRIMKFLCIGALVGVLCVACGGGDEPLPPEPPPPPAISKEPQEINFYYFGDQKVEFKPLKDRVIAKAASIDEAKVLCENEIFISFSLFANSILNSLRFLIPNFEYSSVI